MKTISSAEFIDADFIENNFALLISLKKIPTVDSIEKHFVKPQTPIQTDMSFSNPKPDPDLRLRFIVFRTAVAAAAAAAAAVYFLTSAILLNFLVVVKILLENYINFSHHIKKKFSTTFLLIF